MNHIWTIIEKEWAEVFKNRMVLLTVIIMPLIFTALPVVMLYIMNSSGVAGEMSDVPAEFAALCETNLSAGDCMQIFMIKQFLFLYMMMPLAIPIAIAAYSIVGEKTTRSLEPLLATPITTVELLVGKGLAALLPGVLATWACFGILHLAIWLMHVPVGVRSYVAGPVWLLAILLLGPLMAVAAVNFALIVSARVNDPRAAEQISMVLIVPLLGLLFGQIAGVITVNAQLMLISAAVLLVVDIGLIYLGERLFRRETILTRWK